MNDSLELHWKDLTSVSPSFYFCFGQIYISLWGEIQKLTTPFRNKLQKVANVYIFLTLQLDSVAISLGDVDTNKLKCEWKVLKGGGNV